MSWLDRFFNWNGSQGVQNATPLPQIVRGTELYDVFTGGLSGQGLSEKQALTISAVYASVSLISGAIAALPLNIYRYSPKDGERERIYDDPLHWVLNEEMSPRWSAANGWEYLTQSLLLPGDAFAIIRRGTMAQPIGLTPVHPNRVTVLVSNDAERLIYAVQPEIATADNPKNLVTVYDQDDIIHVPGFGFDGVRGMSPLQYALRMTGGSAKAMGEFMSAFYRNSARPDYALKTEQTLGADVIADMKRQIDENHRGSDNSFRPMILQGGLDIKTITMPMKDMELIDQMRFQTEEIARIYGVPPFMIGATDKTTSWGTGIDSMGIGFVRYTLKRHLNKFENELNRKLFRTAARVLEFDTSDLERADNKSFVEGLRTAVGRAGETRMISINEARKAMRMPRDSDPESNRLGVNPQPSQQGEANAQPTP